MRYSAGARIGPYEVLAPLGAGGMGEVYRARDPKLGREVAVKVLPPHLLADPDQRRRFEQEARALSALNHPNILTIHDFQGQAGAPFLVMELLDGESLRQRLGGRPLPPRRAVDLALQVAQGLAAAHGKGILHRDLKPENLFLCRDGRVKILDFGLAKSARGTADPERSTGVWAGPARSTETGLVMGTAGYMSPEQVRGEDLDARSDLFSLGVVLWEMLTGRRPFQAASQVETLHAILKEEAPDLDPALGIPAGLARIVDRCLAKDRDARFQGAQDLAFALEALALNEASSLEVRVPRLRLQRLGAALARWRWAALGTALAALLVLTGGLALRLREGPGRFSFQRVTFQRGTLTGARFAPDGKTLFYSASWAGGPVRVYSQGEGAQGVEVPGLPSAHLLAVSPTGELALQDALRRSFQGVRPGALYLVRPGVGTPRPVADGVTAADFSPDGRRLAVAFRDEAAGECRLEYPLGTVRHRGPDWITQVRVAPDGDLVAFRTAPNISWGGGSLWLVRSGSPARTLVPERPVLHGLVWDGPGRRLLTRTGDWIEAVDLEGRIRPFLHFPGRTKRIFDRDGQGRLLLGEAEERGTAEFIDEKGLRTSLTWMDASSLAGVSESGDSVLFHEIGQSVDYFAGAFSFLRSTRGEPPVLLAQNYALALSPDGRTALLRTEPTGGQVLLQPVGSGEPRRVEPATPGARITAAFFAPDGRVCTTEREGQGEPRNWIHRPDGRPEPLGPPGYRVILVAPDGRRMVATRKGVTFLIEEGTEPRALPMITPDHRLAGWRGGGTLLVQPIEPGRCRVLQLDLASGRMTPCAELTPAERSGLIGSTVLACRGGRAWAATHHWYSVDLYLATPVP